MQHDLLKFVPGASSRPILRQNRGMTHDDLRFSGFTRDLARRQRRPRAYPSAPVRSDALEQLCGGAAVVEAAPSVPQMLVLDPIEDLID